MRLLHSCDLRFRLFFEAECPAYLILSHTWTGEETTFQEFEKGDWYHQETNGIGRPGDEHGSKEGFCRSPGTEKILKFCSYARQSGYDWVWVDTCCINKESSAELSEAINSMFKWYRRSAGCIVYLSDVNCATKEPGWQLQMAASRWFTRGWTLQELLAPGLCTFVDANWVPFAFKSDAWHVISERTGIEREVLVDQDPWEIIRKKSVATRLSWAAERVTTREEDTAYCLLGLLDVNMALLYGEGDKAFLRLQRKLCKYSSDESIFAWSGEKWPTDDYIAPFFALNPSFFKGIDWIDSVSSKTDLPGNIRQSGTSLTTPVYNAHFSKTSRTTAGAEFVLPLKCRRGQLGATVGVYVTYSGTEWFRILRRPLFEMAVEVRWRNPFRHMVHHSEPARLATVFDDRDTAYRRHPFDNLRVRRPGPPQVIYRFSHQAFEIDSLLTSVSVSQLKSIPAVISADHPKIGQVLQACKLLEEDANLKPEDVLKRLQKTADNRAVFDAVRLEHTYIQARRSPGYYY